MIKKKNAFSIFNGFGKKSYTKSQKDKNKKFR